MDNGNQDIITIYKCGKVHKIYTREFLTMSYKDRLNQYPEIYI